MMFCQHCGNEVDQTPGEHEHAEPMEVTLARIEADRAIQVARISANAQRAEAAAAGEIAETQADASVDAAEVQAEVIAAAIEGSDQPPPEPLEVIAPEFVNNDVDIDDAPPAPEGSEPPAPKEKATFGAW